MRLKLSTMNSVCQWRTPTDLKELWRCTSGMRLFALRMTRRSTNIARAGTLTQLIALISMINQAIRTHLPAGQLEAPQLKPRMWPLENTNWMPARSADLELAGPTKFSQSKTRSMPLQTPCREEDLLSSRSEDITLYHPPLTTLRLVSTSAKWEYPSSMLSVEWPLWLLSKFKTTMKFSLSESGTQTSWRSHMESQPQLMMIPPAVTQSAATSASAWTAASM